MHLINYLSPQSQVAPDAAKPTTVPGRPTSVSVQVYDAQSLKVVFSPPADDGGDTGTHSSRSVCGTSQYVRDVFLTWFQMCHSDRCTQPFVYAKAEASCGVRADRYWTLVTSTILLAAMAFFNTKNYLSYATANQT